MLVKPSNAIEGYEGLMMHHRKLIGAGLGAVILIGSATQTWGTEPTQKTITPAVRLEEESLGTPADVTNLSMDEIKSLSKSALDGDGGAAHRLALHYSMSQLEFRNASYWAAIAAENGNVLGMKLHARYLLNSPYPDQCRRARFWLERAERISGKSAPDVARQLEESCRK